MRALALKMAAFAEAMRARSGEIDREALARLVRLADAAPEDDPLGARVLEFVTDIRVWSRDPVRLAELGADLVRFIDLLNMPEPPDLGRRDIYG